MTEFVFQVITPSKDSMSKEGSASGADENDGDGDEEQEVGDEVRLIFALRAFL